MHPLVIIFVNSFHHYAMFLIKTGMFLG